MEYNIFDFTTKLKEWFVNSALFPEYEIKSMSEYESQYRHLTNYERSKIQSDSSKHPNRHPVHLKEVASQCVNNSTIINGNTATFDYGNVVMESNYPYYHILENSQTIRKRNRATKKSKGSEDMYKIKAHRNYERIIWNGKTFTKEYSRNVRGSRNRIERVSHWGIENGESKYLNVESNSYYNKHYRYIENILNNDVVIRLCSEFGLKLKRVSDTGLIDEFADQEGVSIDSVLEAFDSFM